jgi:hypothetical protein
MPVTTPETPEEAWTRSAVFHHKAIMESLIKVGCRDVADDLKTFPLMTYMPKDAFQ